MTVYVVLAVYLTAAALFELIRTFRFPNGFAAKIINEAALAAGVLAMTVVAGFRLNTGYDFSSTARAFVQTIGKNITELSELKLEKGYILLNLLAGYISPNVSSIYICVAVLFSVLLYIGLKNMTRYPVTGLLSFYLFGFYFNSMNFCRNMLAAIIVFNAYAFLRGPGRRQSLTDTVQISGDSKVIAFTDGLSSGEHMRSFLRYTALVLTASAFHRSALLMIPFWFIIRIRINIVSMPLYLAAGGLIIYFAQPVMEYITTYIYTSYSPDVSDNMMNGIPITYSLCAGAVFAVAFLWRKRFYTSCWDTVLISAAFFDFYFGLLGARHSILSRFALYFGPVTTLILVPELVVLLTALISEKSGQARKQDDLNLPDVENDIQADSKEGSRAVKVKSTVKIEAAVSLIILTASAVVFFVYALEHNYNGIMPHDWIWNLYD